MASHGSLGPFDRETEQWAAYCERLDQYFLANDVTSSQKQRAIFLSVCGPSTYQLIRNLVAPAKPMDKPLKDLVMLVQNHLTPAPSVIVQRYKFNSRSQKDGESVAQYVAQLRRLSEHCQFGDTLEDMLRDRVVCGIRDARVQRRLFSEPSLTFKKAFELAQTAEVADQNTKNLQLPQTAAVHAVQLNKDATTPRNCYRCGGKHAAASCHFKDAVGKYCHKKGHIAKACRTKAKQTTEPQPHHQRCGKNAVAKRTLQVTEAEQTDPAYTQFAVNERNSMPHPFKITVLLNFSGAPLAMELDTGAASSIISLATYQRLWPDKEAPPLLKSSKRLCTYTNQPLVVKGRINITVQYQAQTAELELMVVAGEGPRLFGRDWLEVIRLDWERLNHIHETKTNGCTSCCKSMKRFSGRNWVWWKMPQPNPRGSRHTAEILQGSFSALRPERKSRAGTRALGTCWHNRTSPVRRMGCPHCPCGQKGWLTPYLR